MRDDCLKPRTDENINVFIGNSGVGKSTLLNALIPAVAAATGEVSPKLKRGRHTTRSVELYPFGDGYLADTPGFSALDANRYETIRKEELGLCFHEFEPHLGKCRFRDCSHTKEQGCAILTAVSRGDIPESRHAGYLQMYNYLK
jgi:ribosome biogenesis GTPase